MGGILHISSGKTDRLDEYGRLVREIRHLEEQLARLATPLDTYVIKHEPNRTKTRAARILKLRKCRNRIFDKNMFGEPAWEILLQLYDAQLQGRKNYVADLCAESGVPPSTLFRWIDYLVEGDWIEKKSRSDARQRHRVMLTPKGLDAMDRFFSEPEFTGGLWFVAGETAARQIASHGPADPTEILEPRHTRSPRRTRGKDGSPRLPG